MRRDDLRAMIWENQAAMSVGMQQAALNATRPVSDAEALDAIGRAAALQHWLTDPCPNEKCVDGGEVDADWRVEPCTACDGRGWVPKEGGYCRLDPSLDQRSLTPVLVVPLDWLEDGDE